MWLIYNGVWSQIEYKTFDFILVSRRRRADVFATATKVVFVLGTSSFVYLVIGTGNCCKTPCDTAAVQQMYGNS